MASSCAVAAAGQSPRGQGNDAPSLACREDTRIHFSGAAACARSRARGPHARQTVQGRYRRSISRAQISQTATSPRAHAAELSMSIVGAGVISLQGCELSAARGVARRDGGEREIPAPLNPRRRAPTGWCGGTSPTMANQVVHARQEARRERHDTRAEGVSRRDEPGAHRDGLRAAGDRSSP
jgi:hypothetical protein